MPGASAPRSSRPRHGRGTAGRHAQQLAGRRPARRIVGIGAAVRERGEAEVAEQVGAVVRRAPGGAEADRHAGVEVRAHRREPQPMRRSGAMRCATATPASAISAISAAGGSTTCASHVRGCAQPCAASSSHGVRAVAVARGLGVDLLVEVGVQPHRVVVGRERGELVEQRELVDVHAARRERDAHAARRATDRGARR